MDIRSHKKAMRVELDALREAKKYGYLKEYGDGNNHYYLIKYRNGDEVIIDCRYIEMYGGLPTLRQTEIDYIHAWFDTFGLVGKGNTVIYYEPYEEDLAFAMLNIKVEEV